MILIIAQHNKDLDDDDDWPGDDSEDWPTIRRTSFTDPPSNHTIPPDWLDLISDANSYLSVHLIFTYLFTVLALYFIYKNYRRFIRSRQLFSLELVHSIPARTVLVTNLPNHLQGERPLAEYFENMEMAVESVTVCREVGTLKTLLDERTTALLALERAWVSYVGNPSTVEEYDPEGNAVPLFVDADIEGGQPTHNRLVVPHRQRPTIRPGWFKSKVDALEYLEAQFKEADEKVKKKRRLGKFKPTGAAFVTFEKMSSAVSGFPPPLTSASETRVANCGSTSPCSQPESSHHIPCTGTSRYCLVQHGSFTCGYPVSRCLRPSHHGLTSLFLVLPDHRPRQFVEL